MPGDDSSPVRRSDENAPRPITIPELGANAALACAIGVVAWAVGTHMGGMGILETATSLLEPMNGDESPAEVAQYYGGYTFVGGIALITVTGGAMVLGRSFPLPDYYNLMRDSRRFRATFPGIASVIGAAEEVLFRGLPLVIAVLIGVATWPFLLVGTIVWVVVHDRVQWPMIAIAGVLFLQLWASGLWVEAIIVHVLHNFAVAVIAGVWMEYKAIKG